MQSISITASARQYIARKSMYFARNGRFPRILLLERTCSGARFGLIFDRPADDDVLLACEGIVIRTKQELIDIYEAFELDLERFFFARRVLIKPRRDSRQCDCDTKCNRYNEET